jgi:hypothetical protein
MGLLDRGNEDIVIYPEEVWTDSDGNTMTRPSATGVPARAMIRPAAQSGTSARRAEQDNEGFETETTYLMRVPTADYPDRIGAQARVGWNGQYWAVIGDGLMYNGSRRTRHIEYTIRRT